jgi:hypothetical protein
MNFIIFLIGRFFLLLAIELIGWFRPRLVVSDPNSCSKVDYEFHFQVGSKDVNPREQTNRTTKNN